MDDKAKKTLKYILSLVLAGALLYFAFRGIDWKDFWSGLISTRWGYVLLSLVAAYAALVFRAERWRLQLLPIDSRVDRRVIWHASNFGNFMSIIIPGVGEFVRCARVYRKEVGYEKTFGTILVERFCDVLSILVLLLIAVVGNRDLLLPFMRDNVLAPFRSRFNFSMGWIALALVLFLLAAIWVVLHFRSRSRFCGRIVQSLQGILDGMKAFVHIPHKFLFVLYTVGIWVMYIMMTFLTFLAVPGLEHLSFADAVFISAIGNIASVIPTPGNLGAYHYLVGIAISSIYLGSSEILAMPLLCATLSHGSHAILLMLMALYSFIVVSVRRETYSKLR